MVDPFLILAPILLFAVVGLLQFVGCSFQAGEAANTSDPTFDPIEGSYSGPVSVSISDADSSATVYYTTGTTPPSPPGVGTVYSTPLQISGATTVNAIATPSPQTRPATTATSSPLFTTSSPSRSVSSRRRLPPTSPALAFRLPFLTNPLARAASWFFGFGTAPAAKTCKSKV
jgi:hypothetical protein